MLPVTLHNNALGALKASKEVRKKIEKVTSMDIYLQCNIIYYNNRRGAFKSLSYISMNVMASQLHKTRKKMFRKSPTNEHKKNTISDADCWLHYCRFFGMKKKGSKTLQHEQKHKYSKYGQKSGA